MHENIPGDGLDDVFREFRAVRFDALPLLCAADALIGDGIAAEFICPHLRLHIAELAAGRQNDEQHPAAVTEPDAVRLCVKPLADGGFHRIVHIPPKLHDVRIGGAPRIHKGLEFLLGKPHFQRAHRLERAHRSAISEGEFGDFTFLSQMCVLSVLFHRDMEHGGGAGTVDVAVLRKDLQPPGLAGQKGKHSGFDGGKVRNDEFVPVPRHKRCADEFRQDFRHGVIQCREQGVIPGTDKASRIFQMRHVVLR